MARQKAFTIRQIHHHPDGFSRRSIPGGRCLPLPPPPPKKVMQASLGRRRCMRGSLAALHPPATFCRWQGPLIGCVRAIFPRAPRPHMSISTAAPPPTSSASTNTENHGGGERERYSGRRALSRAPQICVAWGRCSEPFEARKRWILCGWGARKRDHLAPIRSPSARHPRLRRGGVFCLHCVREREEVPPVYRPVVGGRPSVSHGSLVGQGKPTVWTACVRPPPPAERRGRPSSFLLSLATHHPLRRVGLGAVVVRW